MSDIEMAELALVLLWIANAVACWAMTFRYFYCKYPHSDYREELGGTFPAFFFGFFLGPIGTILFFTQSAFAKHGVSFSRDRTGAAK